jgi:hypothetical protein
VPVIEGCDGARPETVGKDRVGGVGYADRLVGVALDHRGGRREIASIEGGQVPGVARQLRENRELGRDSKAGSDEVVELGHDIRRGHQRLGRRGENISSSCPSPYGTGAGAGLGPCRPAAVLARDAAGARGSPSAVGFSSWTEDPRVPGHPAPRKRRDPVLPGRFRGLGDDPVGGGLRGVHEAGHAAAAICAVATGSSIMCVGMSSPGPTWFTRFTPLRLATYMSLKEFESCAMRTSGLPIASSWAGVSAS